MHQWPVLKWRVLAGILLLGLLLAGCGFGRHQLVGSWMEAESQTVFTFGDSGSLKVTSPTDSFEIQYQFMSDNTIVPIPAEGLGLTAGTRLGFRIEGDTLVLIAGGGEVQFTRVK